MCVEKADEGVETGEEGDEGGGGAAAGGKLPGSNGVLNSEGLPPNMRQYADDIAKAAKDAGIDPNLLAAMMWAESRGDPQEASTNPQDGEADVGMMQISQSTYDELRANDSSLPPLDVTDPSQNIRAGAYEMAARMREKGGDVEDGLLRYVGEGMGDPDYVPNVMTFYQDMVKGIEMPDQDPR